VDVSEQKEAIEVFFAVTKLFQSQDIGLRRMVYLMIKEICPSSDEVIFFSDDGFSLSLNSALFAAFRL